MNIKLLATLISASMPLIAVANSNELTNINPEEELAYNLGVQAFIYGTGPLTVPLSDKQRRL